MLKGFTRDLSVSIQEIKPVMSEQKLRNIFLSITQNTVKKKKKQQQPNKKPKEQEMWLIIQILYLALEKIVSKTSQEIICRQ